MSKRKDSRSRPRGGASSLQGELPLDQDRRTPIYTSDAGRRRADIDRLKWAKAVERAMEPVMITDSDGNIEYVNPAFEAIAGYSAGEIQGKNSRLLNPNTKDSFYDAALKKTRSGQTMSGVSINLHRDGSLYYLEQTLTPVKGKDGITTHCIATGRDISEHIEAESQLWHLSHHDLLTGLPNRSYFSEHLSVVLPKAQNQQSQVAVIFLDLDHFKNVNDSLGHKTGDSLLRAVAERLKIHCRTEDFLAHIGGDEFAIIMESLNDDSAAATTARNILAALAMPFCFAEHELFASASIGIALFPRDGNNVDDLARAADTAMYRAKESGRNCFRFFSWDMSTRVYRRLTIETELRHALEREEFFLHYQPLVNANSGKMDSVEALIRWNHPERGVVSPSEFVPVLEECGLITAVSEWVLRTACGQLKHQPGSTASPIRFGVNLSAHQFRKGSLLESTRKILQETSINAQNLVFEITESVLINDAQEVRATLGILKEMGVQIAIDDFGTGYSSLGYLKRIPIDMLKIDRAFIYDLSPTSKNAALVRAIVTMAHALGMQVVAEGVETHYQMALLREYGCDQIQGFYVSEPLVAEKVKALQLWPGRT